MDTARSDAGQSPFKFTVEGGEIVRETVQGNRTGERYIFSTLEEVCEYLGHIDPALWVCRNELASALRKVESIKEIAESIGKD